MKVLVCGASGLIGSNCMRVFAEQGISALGTYYSYEVQGLVFLDTLQLDDQDLSLFDDFDPDVIIHCGALTHVDYCEDHIEESYQKTVQSTINLLKLAKRYGARFVFLSTDYVFDGVAGPYTESDQPEPLSVYGQHKLAAEAEVSSSAVDHIIARVTNVYGDEIRDKNFVARIYNQAVAAEPISLKLPKDQYATPTNAYDIARALCQLLLDDRRGVFHLAGLEYMNRVDLALQVLAAFPEVEYSLEAHSTMELAQSAPRPLRAGLLRLKFSDIYPDFKWTTVGDYVRAKLAQ